MGRGGGVAGEVGWGVWQLISGGKGGCLVAAWSCGVVGWWVRCGCWLAGWVLEGDQEGHHGSKPPTSQLAYAVASRACGATSATTVRTIITPMASLPLPPFPPHHPLNIFFATHPRPPPPPQVLLMLWASPTPPHLLACSCGLMLEQPLVEAAAATATTAVKMAAVVAAAMAALAAAVAPGRMKLSCGSIWWTCTGWSSHQVGGAVSYDVMTLYNICVSALCSMRQRTPASRRAG